VREFLGEAFSSVWVVGEAQRVRPSGRGHVYFELIEKGDRDEIVGKLDAVIWKGDFLKVQRLLAASEQKLVDGVQVRCRGSLDFYAPSGRLQLCVLHKCPWQRTSVGGLRTFGQVLLCRVNHVKRFAGSQVRG